MAATQLIRNVLCLAAVCLGAAVVVPLWAAEDQPADADQAPPPPTELLEGPHAADPTGDAPLKPALEDTIATDETLPDQELYGEENPSWEDDNADWPEWGARFGGLPYQPGRFWIRVDQLSWWTRGATVPPLATTSTDLADRGLLGQPTTQVLIGDEVVNDEVHFDRRYRFGFWLDRCQTFALEGDLFSIDQTASTVSTSDGLPLISRPFFDVTANQQAIEEVAFPGRIAGSVTATVSDNFDSGGAWARLNLLSYEGCCQVSGGEDCCHAFVPSGVGWRLDLIAGYRAYRLNDTVEITEALTTTGVIAENPGIPIGTTFDILDSFRTRNDFNGGELGLSLEAYRNRWSLEMLAKVGMGSNSQSVLIRGTTLTTTPDGSEARDAFGLLALPTNIGDYSRNDFVVIPHLGVEIGYEISRHFRMFLGYDFIYWARVLRGADQIDLNVNPTQIDGPLVGPAAPIFVFQDANFYAQGFNFGMEFRF